MYLWESETAPIERAAADLEAAWGSLAMRDYLFLPSVHQWRRYSKKLFFPLSEQWVGLMESHPQGPYW